MGAWVVEVRRAGGGRQKRRLRAVRGISRRPLGARGNCARRRAISANKRRRAHTTTDSQTDAAAEKGTTV